MTDPKMDTDTAYWWLEILERNLLDADYKVIADDDTHFKLAAIRTVIERSKTLEDALTVTYEAVKGLGKVL